MSARAGLGAALGAAGFVAADFLATAVRVPLLWYQPLERRFELQTLGTGAAMDFYGRLLWCALAGLAVGVAAWGMLGRLDEQRTRQWELRAITWLTAALLLAGALHVTQLVQRNPVPLELPR